MEKNVLFCVMLDFYGDFLTEHQREIMDLHYNDDTSLSEIAEDKGISRQGVHDVCKRAERALHDMEEKLGLAVRELHIRNKLDQCIQAVNQGTREDTMDLLLELRKYLEE